MTNPMMSCGHAANATSQGKPTCAICSGVIEPTVVSTPDLSERFAVCGGSRWDPESGHGKIPSSTKLAFFQYKGPGSKWAEEMCANCPYSIVGHQPPKPGRTKNACNEFVAAGPAKYDTYYDGCHGWD